MSVATSVEGLRTFIHGRLGIQMPPEKIPLLESRLAERLRTLRLASLADYEAHLLRSPDDAEELRLLAAAVTTNKTDFYREPSQLPYLVEHALSPARSGGRARVWCAGCASGEEAYTLAMQLAEHGHGVPGWTFGVLATDISSRVLAHARLGIYARERTTPLPEPWQSRYLRRARDLTRDEVRVTPELRSHVAFRELNFMAHAYDVPGDFDAVFFRNVAIYFDAPTQRRVIEKLRERLKPGGHLFLGQSESLVAGASGLERVAPSTYRDTRST